ncbi:Fe-S cluster biogenesis protein NfuA [Rhodothalassium salexigens DSM 2132]|uniref:Fe-S cluster biogenesis protein NfuA n=1 Tax=Rhodothalassium salexigens DSM 2132 TaxID=1188247 RepID=A0A4V2SPS1_RHOSA|nr:NifU family protein [Rhodothalassium salexigens]MBB4211088.1 Fe-S cluster biogenesis protein NfuA [Rhodothalassium salexigens DSM 2132]MBK1639996.1 NifU family protein [Rhodothalassium salexigens DSM 2132]TCP36256.1 Fe-S cluster biogenesis protein NfuA [Rhodothalassium salexigens DSM 2132]
MFIQTEPTPNPATLKFIPGRVVMEDGTANFTDADLARQSPLAEALFALPGVTGVFYGGDFISVTKDDDTDWTELKPQVLGTVMQHYSSEAPLFTSDATIAAGTADVAMDDDPADAQVTDAIKELLDTRVRPVVAQDGGDIVYQGFKEGIVYLHMQGACSGCPSSTMTLKNGIENLLRYYVPEVVEVRPV